MNSFRHLLKLLDSLVEVGHGQIQLQSRALVTTQGQFSSRSRQALKVQAQSLQKQLDVPSSQWSTTPGANWPSPVSQSMLPHAGQLAGGGGRSASIFSMRRLRFIPLMTSIDIHLEVLRQWRAVEIQMRAARTASRQRFIIVLHFDAPDLDCRWRTAGGAINRTCANQSFQLG
jgi:hypothetical protein